MTVTLHIEHAITELPEWQAAFDRFADRRRSAGVVSHRVWQPVGDDRSVVIQLDFVETGQAEAFLAFLRERVWGTLDAPALVGDQRTAILREVTV